MSTEQNKALLRRFFEELFNKGDLSVADEIVSDDYLANDPAPGETPGLQGLKVFVTSTRTAFPDVEFTIDDMIAEGDKVATRWTFRGTHRGEFGGVPASGNHVVFNALNIHRIANGKLQEAWLKADTLDYLQQMGAIPPMGGGGA
jgi:steroid delta-isomerase-like uncharacterized protein